ncbi:MAG: NAD(P)/FAD-dependent oxidoreductase [Alphaproteobacteria bacterium]|nr:NAD(P)/FAD-dependent oxidoreductase [Alphaproteobacteria bacterium]
MTHTTDVAIIGAGPVGLFAVFECGMLRLKCHVIDALDMVGGQCSALYPEKPIYDIPAHPSIQAQDLVDQLVTQAKPFEPVYHLDQRVEEILPLDTGRFIVKTSTGTEINTGAIIIAAGVGAFGPNRPPLAGIESFEGQSVFYFVKTRESFRNKDIVIGGGGDSAVDWAISLSEIAKSVTVVHRRPKFRAAPESLTRMEQLAAAGKINMAVPYQLAGLQGENGKLSGVIIEDMDGHRKTIDADVLLPFYGLAMNLGPIADWGLNLERNHILIDQSTSQTSQKGIYAIGDIAHYPHKLKLILTGFAEAAHAAHAARALLRPDEVVHFEYSTTKGLPTNL